jgi:hypothetical protein
MVRFSIMSNPHLCAGAVRECCQAARSRRVSPVRHSRDLPSRQSIRQAGLPRVWGADKGCLQQPPLRGRLCGGSGII